MELDKNFVFQTDSDIVDRIYNSEDNYLIEFNDSTPPDYCIIYFSSNNIYYPNTKEVFEKDIINKNKYEWYGTRINFGHKHIFVRDIKKQWYISGINTYYDSPEKLLSFLKEETKGYKIITVGSSAGGYMSVLTGQYLRAEYSFSFNGQFEIKTLLDKSSSSVDPLLFRNESNPLLNKYFDLSDFIINPENIFYFTSIKSDWDKQQCEHISHKHINTLYFNTSNHGIPFLKTNLPVILNMSKEQILTLSGKRYHPILFSLKVSGIKDTINGIFMILKVILNKINK